MKIEDVKVGGTYYVTCKSDCKSCFKVVVEKILNEESVMVMPKTHKKNKEPNPFVIYISALHDTANKAVKGYKQHHKK